MPTFATYSPRPRKSQDFSIGFPLQLGLVSSRQRQQGREAGPVCVLQR